MKKLFLKLSAWRSFCHGVPPETGLVDTLASPESWKAFGQCWHTDKHIFFPAIRRGSVAMPKDADWRLNETPSGRNMLSVFGFREGHEVSETYELTNSTAFIMKILLKE